MKIFTVLLSLILIALIYLSTESKDTSKEYTFNENYKAKIAYLYNNLAQGDPNSRVERKVEAHIRYINLEDSDFRVILKNAADLEFDNIKLVNNNWIVVSETPDAILNHIFTIYRLEKSYGY